MDSSGDDRPPEPDPEPEALRGLPSAAPELPSDLMMLWEVELGETGMAVTFRAGPRK